MMESYDENLGENRFFVELQEQCCHLYDTVATNRWTVCVPKSASIRSVDLTEEDFLNHVIIHTDGSTYKTLSDKEVLVRGSCITTGAGFHEPRTVLILFEETYFNANDESYQVLCLNQCLEGGATPAINTAEALTPVIHSLDDCKQLLWRGEEQSRTQRYLDDLITLFNRTCPRLETESQRHLVDAANAFFTRSMQTVLKDSHLRKSAKEGAAYMDNVKLAVETYIMHGVYRKLFKNIMVYTASKDAHLNKITRNLAQLQLRDLGVRSDFCNNVPRARRELANLKRYTTPLGKLNCIRRVVLRLQQPSGSKNNGMGLPLTTDDLLPILVFLVVKAEMPNWWAHFTYMTSFRFAKASNDDEYGFYLASLEAALEHVGSGQLNSLELGAENPQRVQLSMGAEVGSIWQRQDSSDSQTNLLFQHVKEGNIESIKKLFNGRPKRHLLSDIQSELCHPLCSCEKCSAKVAGLEADPNTATLYSRDDCGHTVLHAAAMGGQTDMTDFLIREGAVINSTDYNGHSPLHIACQKGHQGVTLLLLHYESDVNLQDNDKNSPLHLATANGHEDCVKALLYYDHGNIAVEIDSTNDFGDTPLHLAARWGYEAIVDLLLENGASARTRNRKKQLPLDCAHNNKVSRRLLQASELQNHDWRRSSTPNSGMTRSASMPSTKFTSVSDERTKTAATQTTAVTPDPAPAAKRDTPHLTEVERKVEKLLKAVRDGDIQMARFHLGWADDPLVEEEVDVTQATLCHPLCQCPRCSPLQQLSISRTGIFVNSATSENVTPLHLAALHGHASLVELFCKRGANVNARTSADESSSLHLACQNMLGQAEQVVTLLAQHGGKVNQRDSRGNTPLHYCGLHGNKAAARALLNNGCKVNLANQKGNTALHEAARWKVPSLTSLLLQHGASVHVRNRKQQTPLHLAQSDKVLRLLLEASTGQSSLPVARGSRSWSKSSRSKSVDSVLTVERIGRQFVPSSIDEPEGQMPRRVSMRELLAALEDKELQVLQELSRAIQGFDRQGSLRRTVTRDRSAPRLDQQLACQLSIRHFDTAKLRPTRTRENRQPVVMVTATDAGGQRGSPETVTRRETLPGGGGEQTSGPDHGVGRWPVTQDSGSSTSSEDSDIFVREKKFSVFKPVGEIRSGISEVVSDQTDAGVPEEDRDQQEEEEGFMQEFEDLHYGPTYDSDAEADIYFKSRGAERGGEEEGSMARQEIRPGVRRSSAPSDHLTEVIGEWLAGAGSSTRPGGDGDRPGDGSSPRDPHSWSPGPALAGDNFSQGTPWSEEPSVSEDYWAVGDHSILSSEACTPSGLEDGGGHGELAGPEGEGGREEGENEGVGGQEREGEEDVVGGHSMLSSEACTPSGLEDGGGHGELAGPEGQGGREEGENEGVEGQERESEEDVVGGRSMLSSEACTPSGLEDGGGHGELTGPEGQGGREEGENEGVEGQERESEEDVVGGRSMLSSEACTPSGLEDGGGHGELAGPEGQGGREEGENEGMGGQEREGEEDAVGDHSMLPSEACTPSGLEDGGGHGELAGPEGQGGREEGENEGVEGQEREGDEDGHRQEGKGRDRREGSGERQEEEEEGV